jgi:hypothetical protein
VNIYIPSATSVRTATDSKTQLDRSQFTDSKIKCVHLFKLAARSKHYGGLGARAPCIGNIGISWLSFGIENRLVIPNPENKLSDLIYIFK